MAEKKAYALLRISADVLDAIQHWADDELRSVNAQIEYVLRGALREAGRLKAARLSPPGRTARRAEAVGMGGCASFETRFGRSSG